MWSGQEGSLLFWSLLLAAYGFVLRLRYKTDPRLYAYASVVIAGVQIFFLLLVNFAANPFGVLEGPLRADGSGLNPLLQYAEMVIHPPMLYLGYVGFTVPFAFALGALIMKYPGEKWIRITRRWTMVTWGFLICGIFLGAHWAYSVLGWGGYWGWDPVENASLMPWLVGTAFLHSVMMQEKRGMLKVWNMWLVFAAFWLAILGTFLTRSGIISLGPCLRAVVHRNLVRLVPRHQFRGLSFSSSSRTTSTCAANTNSNRWSRASRVSCSIICFSCCSRSMCSGEHGFRKFLNWCKATKSRSARLSTIASRSRSPCCLILLTAVGPLLAWRKTSFESLKRNFMWPAVGAVAVAVFLMFTPQSWGSIFGLKPWQDIAISIR